jgi:hypothetical protein
VLAHLRFTLSGRIAVHNSPRCVRGRNDWGVWGFLAPMISGAMTGKFPGPQRPSPHFAHYNNLTLLGPPTMRGAIVFAGSSHPKLVEGICDRLGTKQGHATLGKFKNGETSVTIRTSAACTERVPSNTAQTHQSVTRMSSSYRAEARGW